MIYKNVHLRGLLGPPTGLVFRDAAVAYSVRIPAGSSHSGPLLRVRESAGNAEQDFYASDTPDAYGNRFLDTTALLAFVGANNGLVTTWYDLTGGGAHQVQASAALQPSIVTAGVLLTRNGYPCIRSLTQTEGVAASLVVAALEPRTVVCAFQLDTNSTTNQLFGDQNNFCVETGGTAPPVNRVSFRNNAEIFQSAANVWTAGADRIFTAQYDGTQSSARRDGTEICRNIDTSFGYPSTMLRLLYCNFAGRGIRASMHEFVWYRSALSESRLRAIERSQGNAFGITVA